MKKRGPMRVVGKHIYKHAWHVDLETRGPKIPGGVMLLLYVPANSLRLVKEPVYS
jgi:hypothetical protein